MAFKIWILWKEDSKPTWFLLPLCQPPAQIRNCICHLGLFLGGVRRCSRILYCLFSHNHVLSNSYMIMYLQDFDPSWPFSERLLPWGRFLRSWTKVHGGRQNNTKRLWQRWVTCMDMHRTQKWPTWFFPYPRMPGRECQNDKM